MSRNVAVIGDTHGRSTWKQIVAQEKWDRIIFVGDYWDTHKGIGFEEQRANFTDIVMFTRTNQDRTDLLIGNHDFHYMGVSGRDCYSGYQDHHALKIRHELELARDLLQVAAEEGAWVITHAGVTREWAVNAGLLDTDGTWITPTIAESINEGFTHKPGIFRFYAGDDSGYGDHPAQGPLWVRPEALLSDPAAPMQIVGHTTQRHVKQMGVMEPHSEIVLNDALGAGEFVILRDGQMEIGMVNKGERE